MGDHLLVEVSDWNEIGVVLDISTQHLRSLPPRDPSESLSVHSANGVISDRLCVNTMKVFFNAIYDVSHSYISLEMNTTTSLCKYAEQWLSQTSFARGNTLLRDTAHVDGPQSKSTISQGILLWLCAIRILVI
jgi:hypothetical protein